MRLFDIFYFRGDIALIGLAVMVCFLFSFCKRDCQSDRTLIISLFISQHLVYKYLQ